MKVYGLADCNSFFASCEQVFRPDLKNKPVVVLSNNDGCIVSLSKEAKQKGIKRGKNFFEVKDQLQQQKIAVFSSNYTLYQDFSKRVMDLLSSFVDDIYQYSIDESFFTLEGNSATDLENKISFICTTIYRQTGIPISIGIARTKTLAKVANHLGKKNKGYFFLKKEQENEVLNNLQIIEVWGIGYRNYKKMAHFGIISAADFTKKEPSWVRKNFTIMGLQTQQELLGNPCISIIPNKTQSFSSSISFSSPKNNEEDILKSLVSHCVIISAKLENAGLKASMIGVRLVKKLPNGKHFYTFYEFNLPYPTSYVPRFIEAARICLKKLFKFGIYYKSAGITVWNLSNLSNMQLSLFEESKTKKLRMNENKLSSFVAEKKLPVYCLSESKRMELSRRKFLSPCYTTKWKDLPCVN